MQASDHYEEAQAHDCTSYEVNGSTIKSCEVERDLGVSLDCDLTWHAQVSHQAALANKLLGSLRGTLGLFTVLP